MFSALSPAVTICHFTNMNQYIPVVSPDNICSPPLFPLSDSDHMNTFIDKGMAFVVSIARIDFS